MSDNKITIGFMAALVKPVGSHLSEEWGLMQDKLYADTNLQLNYNGDIVYSVVKEEDSYNFSLSLGNPANPDEFVSQCAEAGIPVQTGTVTNYFCHWYNGADSPMSEIDMDTFMERTPNV